MENESNNVQNNNTNQIPNNINNDDTSKLINIEITEDNVELPKVNDSNSNEVKEEIKTNSPLESIEFQEPMKVVEDTKKINDQEPVKPNDNNQSITIGTTLGKIKEDKQKSPITMLVLFGILALFMLFMPEVLKFVNDKLGTNFSIQNQEKEDNNNNNKDNQSEESKIYELQDNTQIFVDKIEFTNFSKTNDNTYKLNFTIKNNTKSSYEFTKKVYLEYYDFDNGFIGRSYIENLKDIGVGVASNYSVEISSDIFKKASKIEIIQRTDDDYPNIEVKSNTLSCEKTNETVIYSFDKDKLMSFRETFRYIKDEDAIKYNSDLITYKSKVSNLDSIEGVTSALTETDNGFIVTTEVDYKKADYSRISTNANYYIKETLAKVINFEMTAKNYTCK